MWTRLLVLIVILGGIWLHVREADYDPETRRALWLVVCGMVVAYGLAAWGFWSGLLVAPHGFWAK